MEWATPVPQLSMATPARNAASCIACRDTRSLPSSATRGRWASTSAIARCAAAAAIELRRCPLHASRACTNASSPVPTVTALRHRRRRRGVEHHDVGKHLVAPRPQLAARSVGDDARAGHLGAGARRRRDGDDRPAAGQRRRAQQVRLDARRSGADDRSLLGDVERRAAAHADDDRIAGARARPARRRRPNRWSAHPTGRGARWWSWTQSVRARARRTRRPRRHDRR